MINVSSCYPFGHERYTREAHKAFQDFNAIYNCNTASQMPDNVALSLAKRVADHHDAKIWSPTENSIHFYAGNITESEVAKTYWKKAA